MGPLKGLKIVEFGGIGPGPFCAQMLADMGAEIIRIERKGAPGAATAAKYNIWHRSRRSIDLDLKKPEGIAAALQLVETADALIEGFRPGVMERLGLGPDVCLERNPGLIYGRMTGWGQEGPLKQAAGHDINYLAISGGLHAIGRAGQPPVPPLNIIGDLGGGGLMLAYGIMCAVFERQNSGKGQVVDAAMVDGCAMLMGAFYGWLSAGTWKDERGANLLDTGTHFYDTYETADGKYISLGSIEPQFYKLLMSLAEIDDPEFKEQMNPKLWPKLKEKIAAVFKTKTRDQWCEIMEGTDVCFAPVLSLSEASKHPHNVERNTFVEIEGVVQPAPAPRFSRTKAEIQGPPPVPGEHTEVALQDWGFSPEAVENLRKAGVID